MKLGIDSYSLRTQGWDPFRMLDYAAEAGLDGVQFSESFRELPSFDPDFLRDLNGRADALRLYVEVGTGSFCVLADQAPNPRINLEIITGTGSRSHPFYERDFWAAFSNTKGSDFARFVQLAVRGQRYDREMVIVRRGDVVSDETMQAFARQQLADFERSVDYCRDVLGLGERGRA